MTGWTTSALIIWLLLSVASIWVWLPWWQPGRGLLERRSVLLGTVTALVVLTGVVATLAAQAPPLPPPWSWLAVGVAAIAALLTGGAVVYCLLALANAADKPAAARARPTVLRGGAWIGALERLALFGTLLAGWPEGIAAIVAVKAFARYPELKTGQASGAIERFIIGTFASLGWAALCAGMAEVLL